MNNYTKIYIAVLDTVPDNMVPVLVAHTILNAHRVFSYHNFYKEKYNDWLDNSYRKCVIQVSKKEFEKIAGTILSYGGFESNIENGAITCLVTMPVNSNNVPNVLKYAKLWKPK